MNALPTPLGWPSWRRELIELLKLAIPLGTAQLAQMLMGVTDTVMMGRIGTDALAAGGLGASISMLMILTAQGLFMTLQPVIAQARGARDESGLAANLTGAMLIGLLASGPIILAQLSIDGLMIRVGEEPSLAALTLEYTVALSWGVVPSMVQGVMRNYLSALGHTHVVLLAASIAAVLNFLLNYALIFGHWGLPRCGLAGAGYATAISWTAMALVFLIYALVFRLLPAGLRHLHLRSALLAARHLARLGWPVAIAWALEVGFFSGTSLLAVRLGAVALAAHQICINVSSVTFMVPLAIGSAASIRTGYHMGARDPARLRVAGFAALGLSVAAGLSLSILLLLFRHQVLTVYLADNDPSRGAVMDLGATLLAVSAGFQLFDGVQAVAGGALRGVNDTHAAMMAAIFGYWLLGIPLAALLAFYFAWGAAGIWWAFLFTLALTAFFLTRRFDVRTRLFVHSAAP